MNISIYLFFIFLTVVFIISGILFKKNFKDQIVSWYGISLILSGISFGVWSIAVITNPTTDVLSTYITAGLVIFMIAQILNLKIATHNLKGCGKKGLMPLGILLIIGIFVLRIFLPSAPEIYTNGMIFFNPNDIVAFFELILIAGAMLSAAFAVSKVIYGENKNSAKKLIVSTIIYVIGIVILLTSTKVILIYLTGWAIVVGVLMLLCASVNRVKSR